jgi:oxygen-dependent protoporphyrinogen oxidase
MERKEGSLARALMKAKPPQPAPGTAPTPLFRSLKGGLGTLVDKLAGYANVVQGSCDSLQQKPDGGYRLKVGDSWMDADAVILACPAWSAAELLGTIDGTLARGLEQTPYSSSAVVTLIYKASEFDGMRAGTGFLIPKVEREKLMACTFVGTKFLHRVPGDKLVLRCFFGGAGNEAVLADSDEGLVATAGRELNRIIGLKTKPMYTTVSRWSKAMAQYTVGHSARLKEIQARCAAIPGLHLAGNAYTGIGIPDCIRMGREAAKKIAAGRS